MKEFKLSLLITIFLLCLNASSSEIFYLKAKTDEKVKACESMSTESFDDFLHLIGYYEKKCQLTKDVAHIGLIVRCEDKKNHIFAFSLDHCEDLKNTLNKGEKVKPESFVPKSTSKPTKYIVAITSCFNKVIERAIPPIVRKPQSDIYCVKLLA